MLPAKNVESISLMKIFLLTIKNIKFHVVYFKSSLYICWFYSKDINGLSKFSRYYSYIHLLQFIIIIIINNNNNNNNNNNYNNNNNNNETPNNVRREK